MRILRVCTRLVLALAIAVAISASPPVASAVSGRQITVTPDQGEGAVERAIALAGSGDTVVLNEGEYRENLVITKELTLTSRFGALSTVITASDPSRPVIDVQGVSGGKVDSVTIRGSDVAGLRLTDSSSFKITNNEVRENINGIHLIDSYSNVIKKNTTTDNLTGIYLKSSFDNVIAENTIDANDDKGLLLLQSNDNIIRANTANKNYWNGITLWSSHRNLLEENVAVKNSYAIVISSSRDNILISNRTMRRLYFLLPVILVYLSIIFYLLEKKIFFKIYAIKYGTVGSPMETR